MTVRPVGVGGGEVGFVVLGGAGQRGAGVEPSPDGELAVGPAEQVPRLHVHADPPQHQGGAVAQPRRAVRHPDGGVQRACRAGVGGPVELAEQVALGVAARLDAGAAAEALLDPSLRWTKT